MSGPILVAGALRVELLPALGGALARFEHDGQPLLRPTPPDAASVLETACFPLVPYANRIRGGRFVCEGREIRLAPNMVGDASPLHGQGWLASWDVAAAGERDAELVFRHEAGEWPWTYKARQHVELDPGGLSLTLTCRNLSPEPMPCGLGFHPYYPCDAGTLLDADVARAWTVDAQVLPVENVPAQGRYGLSQRRICGQGLDNGYDGWSGTATVSWPGQPVSLRLSSPDARRFQVYAPASGGFFAAEPVQNANCALNAPQELWPDLGITLLEPGGHTQTHARFDVVAAP